MRVFFKLKEGIGGGYTALYEILLIFRKSIKKSEIEEIEKIVQKGILSNDQNITHSAALVLISTINSKDEHYLVLQRVLKSIQSLLNSIFTLIDDQNSYLLDKINDSKIIEYYSKNKSLSANEFIKLYRVFSFMFSKLLSYSFSFSYSINAKDIFEILNHSIMDTSFFNVNIFLNQV
jgi:hypothetical protein